MIYGSVCSGIESASVAWAPLGWRAAFYSEIEKFPRTVLEQKFGAGTANGPDLRGDFTEIEAGDHEPIDLLVGGTPCQSFSVAGLRGGLDDPRGNLAIEYLRLARRLKPGWLVFENVPGLLSSGGGRDFGAFLGLLGQCGYGFAYRILDAQYVRVDGLERAVPQRRRRVFVVGYLGADGSGDWRPAAAVLFEPEGLRGDPAPGRETGEGFTHSVAPCIGASGRGFERTGETRGQDPVVAQAFGGNDTRGPIEVATACNSHGGPHGRLDFESETFVAHALRGEGFDASEDGTGRGTPMVPVAIQERAVSENLENGPGGKGYREGVAYTLEGRNKVQSIAFSCKDHGADAGDLVWNRELAMPQTTRNGDPGVVQTGYAVRRLTPRECERLQGLPDDHTRIAWRGKPPEDCPDGPRYKAIGNAMAVNVMRLIGTRISAVDAMVKELAA